MNPTIQSTQASIKTSQGMIERYEADIEKFTGFLSVHALCSKNHVIRCGGIYIVPTVENNRVEAHSKCTWEYDPLKAPQFTKQDAQAVARGVMNGNGDKGEAVGINQAVRDALEQAEAGLQFSREILMAQQAKLVELDSAAREV